MNMNKSRAEKELIALKKKIETSEKTMADLKIRIANMKKRADEMEKFVRAFEDLEKRYSEQFPQEKPREKKKQKKEPVQKSGEESAAAPLPAGLIGETQPAADKKPFPDLDPMDFFNHAAG